jgi:transcriptional regulator with XRE-family HTH domain
MQRLALGILPMKIKNLVSELAALPLRHNTLKAQRRDLGLSRAALARILEVDPSTVYRQELSNPMSMMWNYALHGIAAEAKNRTLQAEVRRHKDDLAQRDRLLGPSRFDANGYKLTAEKMRAATREQAAKTNEEVPKKRMPQIDRIPNTTRAPRQLPKAAINAAVDRAIARSLAAAGLAGAARGRRRG